MAAIAVDGILVMKTLEDIAKAIAELPLDELKQFRAWFEQFETTHFDKMIEQDVNAGKLDQLAEQALADFQACPAREL
jgi:hypothetical protein